MIIIDRLCYTSGLRYVNAMEKFVFSMLTLLLCVSSRSVTAAVLVLFVTGILTVGKGGIPLSRYIRLMSIPLVFLFLSTAAVLVNISRTPLDAFAIPFGSFYLTGSVKGILRGAQLILTALASVSCLYFLSLSTPLTDILGVLKKLHVPGLIIELMLLIYRYIFITLHTASAILTSQKSRLGNKNLRTARKAFAAMAGSLFILSVRRSCALYDAMEARCYNGRIQVLKEERPARYSEIFCIAGFEVFLFALIVVLKCKNSI
ncbi:MAG: cobalt ECF transporter T component CbiQ [Lachnospiraceae bacterium]